MLSQDPNKNQTSISVIQYKQDQINDLINSIQNKLSMLACNDQISHISSSKLSTPKKQLIITNPNQPLHNNQNTNNCRMSINQLIISHNNQLKQPQQLQLSQSKILSKINQMQHYYMNSIQSMIKKISILQSDKQSLLSSYQQLKNQNTIIKLILNQKQQQQNNLINQKLQSIKLQLINKFTKQAQLHQKQYIKEINHVNNQLLQEKSKNKYLQEEVHLLKNQKKNLQEFYKNLLDNHRNMIKFDIQKSQKNVKDGTIHKLVTTNGKLEGSTSTIRKKNKKKQKNSFSKKQEQMTNEQMIPFLAKGIQQLKDKLKLK